MPLTRLFNTFLTSGTFPDVFKQAYVIPLLKKYGLDKLDYANYQPIFNFAFLGKVLERIVLTQLNQHLSAEPSLKPFQSAYQRHHSTETALTKITNDILPKITIVDKLLMFLDFSAAFNTINHHMLIERLPINFNISSVALEWFRFNQNNRQQSVYVDQSNSASATMSRGVPQGSVLGPILYTMYTGSLHHVHCSSLPHYHEAQPVSSLLSR